MQKLSACWRCALSAVLSLCSLTAAYAQSSGRLAAVLA